MEVVKRASNTSQGNRRKNGNTAKIGLGLDGLEPVNKNNCNDGSLNDIALSSGTLNTDYMLKNNA